MADVELRAELSPPPVSPARLDDLCREIDRIAELVLTGAQEAPAAIAAFNAATGHAYRAPDFAEYDGSRSREDFAREAARPSWPRVPGITRAELAEIVRRILAVDPECGFYLRLLEANVPNPAVSDLLFRPPAALADATVEQLVDAALRHRPIAL
ncbi:hypothetical protein ACFVHB_19540 [Kitasatospora sp. NPDC127111]|uniref:hypothetical protein n=1 Tax=Kitasatospora sp. NPDC127111 TaxID=3345363 RepID=UPI0036398C4D